MNEAFLQCHYKQEIFPYDVNWMEYNFMAPVPMIGIQKGERH
jgi:hypothetical protein